MSTVQHSQNSGAKSKLTKVAVKVTRKPRNKRRRTTGSTEKSVSDEEYISDDQEVMNIDLIPKKTKNDPSREDILNEINKSSNRNEKNFKQLSDSIRLIRADVSADSMQISSLSKDIVSIQQDRVNSNISIEQLQRDCENS